LVYLPRILNFKHLFRHSGRYLLILSPLFWYFIDWNSKFSYISLSTSFRCNSTVSCFIKCNEGTYNVIRSSCNDWFTHDCFSLYFLIHLLFLFSRYSLWFYHELKWFIILRWSKMPNFFIMSSMVFKWRDSQRWRYRRGFFWS